MRLFNIVTVILITFLFTGCFCETPEPIVKIKTITVEKTVPCDLPKVHCDFHGEGFEPTQKLLDCVVIQKKALETCAKFNKSTK